jgi:hypothetical protein
VPLIVLEGSLLFFVEAFLLFDPFFHLSVAITGGVLFSEKGLPGFFHGEYVVENDDLVEFIG